MIFLSFRCSPNPDTEAAKRYRGAFVNCWIDGHDLSKAQRLAQEVISEQGWKIEALEELYPIARGDYADGHSPEGLAYFEQAEIDGACYVFLTYARDERG